MHCLVDAEGWKAGDLEALPCGGKVLLNELSLLTPAEGKKLRFIGVPTSSCMDAKFGCTPEVSQVPLKFDGYLSLRGGKRSTCGKAVGPPNIRVLMPSHEYEQSFG
jgi:hypothetical protein